MNLARSRRLALLFLPLFALSGSARAELAEPGSLLLYPFYQSAPGAGVFTLMTVTNIDTLRSVDVQFVFRRQGTCSGNELTVSLTPRDTYTFLTTTVELEGGTGWAYAYAANDGSAGFDGPVGTPVSFNRLIGTTMVIDGFQAAATNINPVTLASPLPLKRRTDANANGRRDLDDVEYAATPRRLMIPRFFGQSSGGPGLTSSLVLIDLTGGAGFATTANMIIANDNEQIFSRQVTFSCFELVPLLDISTAFENGYLANFTDDDPNEVAGAPFLETGWIEMWGAFTSAGPGLITEPAILAVLLERGVIQGGSLPFGIGANPKGTLGPR